MNVWPTLSLPEWTVLAVVDERPTHGFAIAQLTAPQGELGRIWQIPRPVVYRAIGRLLDARLILPGAVESRRGPQRTIYTATPAGREALRHWLDTPVTHIREVRSHLLLKLALLDRAGGDPSGLLERQKAALAPIAEAVKAERPGPTVSTRPCWPGAGPPPPRRWASSRSLRRRLRARDPDELAYPGRVAGWPGRAGRDHLPVGDRGPRRQLGTPLRSHRAPGARVGGGSRRRVDGFWLTSWVPWAS